MRDAPLWHASFRRFQIARALSVAGNRMHAVAVGYLVLRLTGALTANVAERAKGAPGKQPFTPG